MANIKSKYKKILTFYDLCAYPNIDSNLSVDYQVYNLNITKVPIAVILSL